MPPPGAATPCTPTNRLLAFPGSRTISVIEVFPVPGTSKLPCVVTNNLVNVTEPGAAVALVERYTPRRPSGPTVLDNAFPPTPETPVAVATKIVAVSVGLTTMLLIDRPPKQVVMTEPPPETVNVKLGFIGPARSAVVSALSMR